MAVVARGGAARIDFGEETCARAFDLGAGRGWPGLYLAQRSGCRVVATDIPLVALRIALARARAEALPAWAVASSARALALRAEAFDAVVHADVLC